MVSQPISIAKVASEMAVIRSFFAFILCLLNTFVSVVIVERFGDLLKVICGLGVEGAAALGGVFFARI